MKKFLILRNILKYVFFFIFCFYISFTFISAEDRPNGSQFGLNQNVKAILLDLKTGKVFFEQNSKDRARIASTTKIMTVYLALLFADEYKLNLDDRFIVENEAISVGESSMGLQFGAEVSLRDLLYGAMLPSGNDAANMIATRVVRLIWPNLKDVLKEEILNGDLEAKNLKKLISKECNKVSASDCINIYVKLMNKKAKELKMFGTHFVSVSGLELNEKKSSGSEIPDEYHYSTASDMAKLSSAAMNNSEFSKICKHYKKTLTFGNPPEERTIINKNKLLSPNKSFHYSGACGIKTGWTTKAQRCLVSAAKRNDNVLICITLGVEGKIDWEIHRKLFDYGFSKYNEYNFSKLKNPKDVKLKLFSENSDKEISVVLEKDIKKHMLPEMFKRVKTKISDIQPCYFGPVNKGAKVGTMEYYLNGRKIAETGLLAEKYMI